MRRKIKYWEFLLMDRFLVYFRNYPTSYYYHFKYSLAKLKRRVLRQPEPILPIIMDEAYVWLDKRKNTGSNSIRQR